MLKIRWAALLRSSFPHLIFFMALGFTWLALKNQPLTDELAHQAQIERFMRGDFSQEAILTVIPGYHALIAFASTVVGADQLLLYRLITTVFSALGLYCVLSVLSRQFFVSPRIVRVQQIYYFPIIFFLVPLLYTDVMALVLVLACFSLLLADRFFLAALFGVVAIALRQHMVVWVFLVSLIRFVDFFDWSIIRPGLKREQFKSIIPRLWASRSPIFGRAWPLSIPFVIFSVFVIVNGGIAMGDRSQHEITSVNLTQIYFLLVVFWVVFLPLQITSIPLIFRQIRSRGWLLGVVVLGYFGFEATFAVSHPYNHLAPDYFLRNSILRSMLADDWFRFATFLAGTWAIFTLAVTRFRKESYFLLYPLTFLGLLMVPLIEQRYYIVPLVLFSLFRVAFTRFDERVLLFWFIGLSLLLAFEVTQGRHFL